MPYDDRQYKKHSISSDQPSIFAEEINTTHDTNWIQIEYKMHTLAIAFGKEKKTIDNQYTRLFGSHARK